MGDLTVDIASFLSELRNQDIQLQLDGERLKINAPKGALTPSLRTSIQQRKADIIGFYQHQTAALSEIQSVSRETDIACSFAQQRLWLLDKLETDGHAYTIPLSFRALGHLNMIALQAAVNEIIRRHEILRTMFREPEGENKEPCQRILPTLTLEPRITDLSHLTTTAVESKICELASSHINRPFNLSKDSLLRLNIIKVTEQHHVLLFTVHHIVFDGLSLEIFLRELSALYPAFSQGSVSPLPKLNTQYADYSVWQRQKLSGQILQDQLTFWQQTLEGASPVLGLPTDYPRPAVQRYAGARHRFEVNAVTTDQFRHLSQQSGTTAFMAFHTVLAILLARYSGKTDIIIGTPVGNRSHQALEPLIGLFANTLVLRSDVQPNSNFNTLLAEMKHRTVQAFKHQELPFEKLVDELKIERSLSHNPLFQVFYSFQSAHTDGFTLPGIDLIPLAFGDTASKFDLSFIVREHQDTFTVILEYSTALFKASTMKRLADHFQTLINAIVQQPDRPISQLSLLTRQEVQQLQAWNDTAVACPLEKTLIDLFEAQVQQTPEAFAVTFGEQSLTYHQLNQKANQLAHHLLHSSACQNTPDPLIAICVERSPDMVIGLLGILKAGAAYVPIDPNYPEPRIRHMLTDSEAGLILTQSALSNVWPLDQGDNAPQRLCLDEDLFANHPDDNPQAHSQANDLAYVIYTSGSTGQPKGVMIEHRSLSNFLQDMQQRTGISVDDRLLAVTTLSFDIAALELYLPLISGSHLYLTDKATNSDAQALQQQLQQQRINFMQATPATWQLLRHNGWQAQQPLNILCGGEALPVELANYLLENSSQLWNLYGPTETTIWSAACPIQTPLETHPPIGQPITNTRIYILDAQQNIQPIGVPGELCIAGEGLARGYLNRPELTADKFIETDLFGKRERIYQTGDLARWQAEGQLEYLGRLDDQVKIRGFRIELGEIETHLSRHPDVKEVVVIARPNASGEQQLLAYLLMQAATPPAALKSDLQQALPDYMIPAFFIILETFPLLPNGKINRQALPEPDRANTQSKGYMHPRNSLELKLSQLWEKALHVSPISVFDNFFDIGGDSLLAIRLIADIEQQLGIRIALNSLFQHNSIEQLTCLLRRDSSVSTQNSPLVALQSQGTEAPIFCVHAAGGIVFRYLQIAKLLNAQYNHPFYGLQARGIEPGESAYDSIEDMARHYVTAIRQIKPQGPYLLAGWSMGGTVAFEMARQLESASESVSGLIMIDAPSPYMDAYEADDIDFLLERLEPAAGINIHDAVEQQASAQAKKLYILEQKKQLGLFPPDIQLAEAEQRLWIHKYHNQLLCRYQPDGVIKAGIAFIKATEVTTFDEKMKDPVPAWAEFTHRGIFEHESPGNHFNMFSNEHCPILAEKLHACIQDLGFDP